MESIPKLNRAAHRRVLSPLLFVLCIALSSGLLRERLAAIYARPVAVPPVAARLPPELAGEEVTIPSSGGFRYLALRHGGLLLQGPRQLLGQQDISLCEQRSGADADATLLPLHVGWNWAQVQEAAAAHRATQPSRPAYYELKNPLLDDGPGGVDVPLFTVTAQPPETPLRPYGDAQPLWLTVRDPRPVLMLADTAEKGAGPTLAFRRDLWLLWNVATESAAATDRWDYAVRVRRLADRVCPFGRVQLSGYGPPATVAKPTDVEPRTVLWYSGQGPAREFRLTPGHYAATPASPPRREDAELFSQALTAGLLRLGEDGRIAVAPADLPLRRLYARTKPDLLTPRDGEPDWLAGQWGDEVSQLHRALHFSVTGRYVRQQVEAFNARQLLAAVRWRPGPDLAGDWRVDWVGAPLTLTATMPLLAGRLFTEVPQGWQPWRRVARWPALAGQPPVRFRLTLTRPAQRGAYLELLVVGAAPTLTGAAVLASAPRCLEAQPCTERDAVAHWLRLALAEGTTLLDVQFQPLPATAFPEWYRYDFAYIQREEGRLVWRDPPVNTGVDPIRPTPAVVTLRDRSGAVLLERGQPTDLAWSLGLAALVGLDPAQDNAVGGVLAQLSAQGMTAVDAHLTVERRLQTAARQALLAQLSQVSAAFGGSDPYWDLRVASLVVLDADRGDIVAVANSPEPPRGVAWSDLYSFAVSQPRRSPLRIWAWQYNGGDLHPAGSVFELVDALLLEREASHRPELAAILAGLAAAEWAQLPLAQRYAFGADAGCYPVVASETQQPEGRSDAGLGSDVAVCNGRGAANVETLLERMQQHGDARYGLAQALRDSLSTWFAWLVETTDATLLDDPRAPGLASVRALTPAALREARPLSVVLATLGFGKTQSLDGGLLPTEWLEFDNMLRTTPSTLDPISTRAQVRLAALGLRMQVTPLQLAEVAATIATGQQTPPRVLAELNGRSADGPKAVELGIPTERIRQGMQQGIADSSTYAAFAAPRFDALRPYLYTKTGAAALDEAGTVQNAWLVGWLEPGALPGEKRRLAFACTISHTVGMGGEACGRVVADWLAALLDERHPD